MPDGGAPGLQGDGLGRPAIVLQAVGIEERIDPDEVAGAGQLVQLEQQSSSIHAAREVGPLARLPRTAANAITLAVPDCAPRPRLTRPGRSVTTFAPRCRCPGPAPLR